MTGLRELTIVFAVGLLLATSGCVVTTNPPPARSVVVTGPPPAPLAENPPAPPDPGAVWVNGYWHWNGVQYAWIPGRWQAPPPGSRWYGPRYSQQGGTYFYQPGGWQNQNAIR